MSAQQCLRRVAASRLPIRSSPLYRVSFARIGQRSYIIPASTACRTGRKSQIPPRATPISLTPHRTYADKIVKVPEMAESITEGTLKQFSKQVGDHVEQDEEIATIETDKIDVSVNAPEAGTIKEFLVKEEDTVTVGQDLVRLELGGEASGGKEVEAKQEPKEPASKEQETSSQPGGEQEQTTPQPQEMEKPQPPKEEKKPEPKPAPPKQEQKAQPPKDKKPEPPKKEAEPPKKEGQAFSREEHPVKMNRMRLRIAERLKQSQNTAAFLTTFNQVDMSKAMEFRSLYKDEMLKKTGVKLGFMSMFSRAVVLAMKEVPLVNASITGPNGGDTIVHRDYIDISVAVATEKGLVTPVVRNAESLDMMGIEKEIANLGKKARDNKLTIEDMAGGTFTISNGGVFGSLVGTPIINLPQTAVLGLHAIKNSAVAVDAKTGLLDDKGTVMAIKPIMWLALTYDHRLLDGKEAVTFLVKVREFIQDPQKMLLG